MVKKILFLGYDNCKILDFLRDNQFEITQTSDKISLSNIKHFDFIISFGYRYIITSDIINFFKNKIINLHISFLPYNRGSDPNFWSFRDNTPKGVTIQIMGETIDGGDILLQREIQFPEHINTLSTTYQFLFEEIQELFIENYYDILNCKITPKPQIGAGSFHYTRDLKKINFLLKNGWNTNVNYIMKKNDLDIIKAIEQVRSKNNINWMDILRIAIKYAPDETRKILNGINEHDKEISELIEILSKNNL